MPLRWYPAATCRLDAVSARPRRGIRSGVVGLSPAQVSSIENSSSMGAVAMAALRRLATPPAVGRRQ